MKVLYIIIFLSLAGMVFSQEVIQDTSHLIDDISGGILYSQGNYWWYIYTNVIYQNGSGCGDGDSPLDNIKFISKGYLSFSMTNIPEGYQLQSSVLHYYIAQMIRNNVIGAYPSFEMASGYTYDPPCMLEHVDYGVSLDLSDIDVPMLHPGKILVSEYEIDWKKIDVTSWILDDIANGRMFSQMRLKLLGLTDWDSYYDTIGISGNSVNGPYILHTFVKDSVAVADPFVVPIIKASAYPCPFIDKLSISLKLNKPATAEVSIYNLKGQLVRSFSAINSLSGKSTMFWDGISIDGRTVPAGLYIVRIEAGGITKNLKVIKL